MAIEIKSTGFKEMIIKGQTVQVKKPSLSAQAQYEADLKAAQTDGASVYSAMINWLGSLGIEESLAKQLDFEEFSQISEEISGSKKN